MQKPPFPGQGAPDQRDQQADGYDDSITDVEQRAGDAVHGSDELRNAYRSRFEATTVGLEALRDSSHGCYDEEA